MAGPRKYVGIAAIIVGLWLLTIVALSQPTESKTLQRRQISLNEVYTTSSQADLKQINGVYNRDGERRNFVHPGGSYIDQLNRADLNGASDGFLVDAVRLENAIAASSSILLGGRAASSPAPVNTPNPRRGHLWLVVYLGCGPSEPDAWEVESVSVNQRCIRFCYGPTHRGESADIHKYYYWAPLGKLEPGAYSVELYDNELKSVTLARRVEVSEPESRRR